MAAETPPTGQRTELADLIRERRKTLGFSLQAFADRAVDPVSGVTVKPGWIHRLEKADPDEPVIPPRLPQLRALAAAAQVSVESTQEAAGRQFFGIDPVEGETGAVRALVRRVGRLTPDQQEQLSRLIDTFVPPTDQ